MKVMVISSSAPLGKGESFVVEEVNALADAGNDVVLVPTILRKGTPNQFKLGARVSLLSQPTLSWPVFYSFVIFALSKPAALFRLICLSRGTSHKNRWKNYFVIPKAAWVAKVLKSDPVDHIHAHWLTTPATLAMFVSDISGITWSATGHRGDIVANNLLDAKFKKAEFVRFISESGVRLARARATVNESKIHILHLGVKIPALDCAKNECAAKGGAKMNVLCPANLIAVKGHQILFQAVSVMRNKSLIDLTIAGVVSLDTRLNDS